MIAVEKREKWLSWVSQCMGGATMISFLFLLWILLTEHLVKGSDMMLALLLPLPGLIGLPLVALIGNGILHDGYFDALVQTVMGYCRGALLGIAMVAITVAMCALARIL